MIFVLDNNDSFTFNLVHYLGELGQEVGVASAGDEGAAALLTARADAVVISPGPGHPTDAHTAAKTVAACASAGKPLLGVCLGHQVIGCHFGGTASRAETVMHGKPSQILHDGDNLFAGLPSPFTAIRYHSLIMDRSTFPADLEVTATAPDGTVQGLRHRSLPIFGVQFHPESIATEHGHDLLRNFLALAKLSGRCGP
jgi:anthranilate synthase component 2